MWTRSREESPAGKQGASLTILFCQRKFESLEIAGGGIGICPVEWEHPYGRRGLPPSFNHIGLLVKGSCARPYAKETVNHCAAKVSRTVKYPIASETTDTDGG